MNVNASRLGVPYLLEHGEVIPLTHSFVGDLIAQEYTHPGTLDALMLRIKVGVEALSGIDADLDDLDWMSDFNNLLAINEFTTPLHVLAEARRSVAQMKEAENV